MYKKYLNNEIKLDKKTILGIIALIIVISGVFGCVYEIIFYYFNGGMKEVYYRGGNFLPWINIYAYGALLVHFSTKKIKNHPLLVFILSALVTGILELGSGYVLYGLMGKPRCWDYNVEILNFGNIGGYVCLRSVLVFGLSSLLLIYVIEPLCYYLAIKLNKKVFLTIALTLCSIFLIDEVYNLAIAKIIHTPRASTVYSSLGVKYVDLYKDKTD